MDHNWDGADKKSCSTPHNRNVYTRIGQCQGKFFYEASL